MRLQESGKNISRNNFNFKPQKQYGAFYRYNRRKLRGYQTSFKEKGVNYAD